jgi:hypothetical protein
VYGLDPFACFSELVAEGEDDDYEFRSCSRDILKGCSPIRILKTALKRSNLQSKPDFQTPRAIGASKISDFEPFLIYQSGYSPLDYRGSSY